MQPSLREASSNPTTGCTGAKNNKSCHPQKKVRDGNCQHDEFPVIRQDPPGSGVTGWKGTWQAVRRLHSHLGCEPLVQHGEHPILGPPSQIRHAGGRISPCITQMQGNNLVLPQWIKKGMLRVQKYL